MSMLEMAKQSLLGEVGKINALTAYKECNCGSLSRRELPV